MTDSQHQAGRADRRLRLRIRAAMAAMDQTPERLAEMEEELTVWLSDAAEAEGLEPAHMDDEQLDTWLKEQVPDWPALVARLAKSGARHQRPTSSRARSPRPLATGSSFFAVALHELRFSLRQLRRRPAFALIAILTLGLGVGVVAAVFSTVDAVIFKPVDLADGDQLMNVYVHSKTGMTQYEPMAWPDIRDIGTTLQGVEQIEAYAMAMVSIDDGQIRLAIAEQVTGGFFQMLGLQPKIGRLIDESDRGASTAVLAHHIWQRDFGSSTDVLGKTIRANGQVFTIVGVAPENFRGLFQGLGPELWLHLETGKNLGLDPLQGSGGRTAGVDLYEDRNRQWLWTVARMADGASQKQLQAELEGLLASLKADHPRQYEERRFTVVPTTSVRLVPDFDRPLFAVGYMALAVAGLVLLIACANLANMLLARAIGRAREFALRQSMGAGFSDLVRQLSIENLWIALGGGVLGLGIARLAVAEIQRADLPSPVPLDFGIVVDSRVFLVVLVSIVVISVGLGLVPILAVAKGRLAAALREGAAGSGHRPQRLRSFLVVSQVALSAILLIGAGLMTRSLAATLSADPGFNPDGVVAATFAPNLQGFERDRIQELYRQLDERLEAVPGVQAVSMIDHLPLRFEIDTYSIPLPSSTLESEQESIETDHAIADVGYFELMDIPLLDGRGFEERDRGELPKVVINEVLASRLWPGESPVGRTVDPGIWDQPATIIGVAKTGAYRSLGEAPRPFLYSFADQYFDPMQAVLIKHAGSPEPIFRAVRQISRRLDPRFDVLQLETLEQAHATSAFVVRFGSLLLTILGTVGLALSAVGLYGILALRVRERRRSLGIRLALGDTRTGVIRRVIQDGLRLVAVGLIVGYIAAAVLGNALESLLYGIGPRDPITFAVVSVVLLVAAAVACGLPALRAARIEPAETLRHD